MSSAFRGLSRFGDVAFAAFSLALGTWLAFHHPLGKLLPLVFFCGLAASAAVSQQVTLFALPAVLPLIGLAPWTGWIVPEEADILAFGLAAGGYARWALYPAEESVRWSRTYFPVVGLYVISLTLSTFRGFSDAGGFSFGWFQGYNDPMNSLRVAKPFFLALLIMPLWGRFFRLEPEVARRTLGYGIVAGLSVVALATVWERIAYTDLLNFSSDYRTTALFWEMHIGGAALDGWLVLTTPFVVWLVRRSQKPFHQAIAYALMALVAYACLTTFSRGVYVALAVSLLLLPVFLSRQNRLGDSSVSTGKIELLMLVLVVGCFGGMAVLVFPSSGYRGLLALLGVAAIAWQIPSVTRSLGWGMLSGVTGVGGGAGIGFALLAAHIPKGPYFLFGGLFVLAAVLAYAPRVSVIAGAKSCLVATFVALLPTAIAVAAYWGGAGAAPGMAGGLVVLGFVLIVARFLERAGLRSDTRICVTRFVAGGLASAVAAVFLGGAYMGERFATSSSDFEGRLVHWRHATSLLQTDGDLWLGKGMGRFSANYYFSAPNGALPGGYRLQPEGDNTYLALTGARHPLGFGEILRISQRLPLSVDGPFVVEFRVRTKVDAEMHVEVCEKHLLYHGRCALINKGIKAADGVWQKVRLRLEGDDVRGFSMLAPRFKVFSIGLGSSGSAVDVDDLSLIDGSGVPVLRNGDFSDEMARWFFTSDRDHMPWHAKNFFVNVLFDQGIFGLLAAGLLILAALWRLNIGAARHHEFAPYLTAGIIGFLIVGLIDSLVDVSRLALLYYLLLLYSIGLAKEARRPSRSGNTPSGVAA